MRRLQHVLRSVSWIAALGVLLPFAASPAAAVTSEAIAAEASGVLLDYVSLTDGVTWVGDRVVATQTDPLVQAGVCSREEAGYSSDDLAWLSLEFRITGDDYESNETLAISDDGTGCFYAEWRVPELPESGTFGLTVRTVTIAGARGDWIEGDSFIVAPTPAVPSPLEPQPGAVITSTKPEFVAQLDQSPAFPQTAVFRVVDSETGVVEGEGVATEVSDDDVATWSPTSLNAGRYTWQVLATDEISQSDWSEPTEFRISLPPSAPVIYSTSLSRRGVTAYFTTPASPDAPILDYTLRIEPGGFTSTVPASRSWAAVDGLEAGTYTATVTARNENGESAPSPARVVTLTPPVSDSPTNVNADVVEGTATVTWDPPSDDGGVPVLEYEVTETRTGFSMVVPAEQRSVTIDGLIPTESYEVIVRARTERGCGLPALYGFVYATPPGAPSGVTALLGDQELTVRWAPPEFDGGAYVSKYLVTATPGGAQKTVQGSTQLVFDGLENGVEYTFVVAAVNEAGIGPGSDPSPPKAPTSRDVDTDHDGLSDILEERSGANPLLADSDFDGLSDAVEVLQLISFTSPVSPDSDEDGVSDADTDSDADGLTNHEEVEANTDTGLKDTDSDGVSDGDELAAGSDPRSEDADGDGLKDQEEIALGLNPAVADTDGDGVGDYVSITQREVSGDGASLQVAGAAGAVVDLQLLASPTAPTDSAVAGVATITDATADSSTAAAAASSALTMTATPSLTFTLSKNQPMQGGDFAAFRWDADAGDWTASGLTVTTDSAAHTVRVLSPDLDTPYTVVDMDEWRARARACYQASLGNASLDVELVFDETPSVNGADPDGARFDAAEEVINTLRTGDDVRIRTFGYQTVDSSGGGESYQPEYGEGPPVVRGGVSLATAKTQLTTLKSLPVVPQQGPDRDNAIDGFAETALGRMSGTWHMFESNPYLWQDFGWTTGPCRSEAIVLVTDGQLIPGKTNGGELGYVPFRLRNGPPVHVLDVGVGNGSNWLRDVATRTGGSYTHVPSQAWVNSWSRNINPWDLDPSLGDLDDDQDGLSNYVEIAGVRAANPGAIGATSRRIFYSDPHNPDTDGDGLLDGEESGTPLSISELGGWFDGVPVTTFRVRSDPGRQDGDFDGLVDSDELELGLPALDGDIDDDLLADGDEGQWGTNPYLPDVDHDGFSDGFEATNADDGYDPWLYNRKVDVNDWLRDFQRGFILGNADPSPPATWAWMVGNALSGVVVLGDVRDLAYATADGNSIDANWAVIGLVPAFGDLSKAGREILERLPSLGETLAQTARRQMLVAEGIDGFVAGMRQLHPSLVKKLEDAGASTREISEMLVNNEPLNLERVISSNLATLARNPTRPAGYVNSGQAGEDYVRQQLGKPVTSAREEPLWLSKDRPALCRGCRYPDVVTVDDAGDTTLHEVKVGQVSSQFAQRQIQKDAALLQAGKAESVHWHFMASSWNGKIGPSSTVLTRLVNAGIPFTIYLPG